ncbi:MAG: prephenate dehydratase [Microbacteriaceae bacterium]|nr:prephenate dehydratase [Microbacteriaceae bacterium]
MTRVAYLGPEGTFTEAALVRMAANGMVPCLNPSSALTPVPADTAPAALAAVRSRDADYACVPIENSIDGFVATTLNSLATGKQLHILAELTLDIDYAIVVQRGCTAADIKTVAAFPVAAAQVRHWLAVHLPKAHLVCASSNAAAAHAVSHFRADAAVSTELAAARFGVPLLAFGVADQRSRTRFVLVGPPGSPAGRTGADRTSVVLCIDNASEALVSALTELAIRGIDLTRIGSRPTRTELGTYMFFLGCVGHIEDAPVAEALTALQGRCADVRYLGSWPIG